MTSELENPTAAIEPTADFVSQLGPLTQAWCAKLRNRMSNDWDNMIGIQGERGSGKSTLAVHLALEIDPDFNIDHVFYSAQDWKRTLRKGHSKQVFVLDEGTNIAFNRTWAGRDQVALVQLLNTIRQKNHTMIWCAPNLERMDTVIRGDILTHKISVTARGKAILQERRYNWEQGTSSWPKRLYINFGSLKQHPIWPVYEERKRAAYKAAERTGVSTAGRSAEELAAIRPGRDPVTHKFVKNQPVEA